MIIKENEPLNDKNWFRTGGPARYFCEPSTADDFKKAFLFAKEKNLEFFVLGHGANTLISDDGFNGLIIRPQRTAIHIFMNETNEALVTAGAGTLMDELIQFTLDHNLIGLEEFSNIPGTVGGSVFINLHYFQHFLSHFLTSAQLIHCKTFEMKAVDTAWFNFGYDQSKLMDREYILFNATFKLKKVSDVETAFAKGRRAEITRQRTSRYPHSNTCGSFFRNFHPEEVTLVCNGEKMIYAAFYLDKVGVRGMLECNGTAVSYQHANMIVSAQNAQSKDIIHVARTMQKLVKEQFNVILQPECLFVGFKEYPLLQ